MGVCGRVRVRGRVKACGGVWGRVGSCEGVCGRMCYRCARAKTQRRFLLVSPHDQEDVGEHTIIQLYNIIQ